MYQVKFTLKGKPYKLPFETVIPCADLERALALASMLQKISTDLVKMDDIIVEPLIIIDHEKK